MSNKYKQDFPLFQNIDVAYLDNAASTQKPQAVLDALNDFYTRNNANVHRGLYKLSAIATERYEAARVTVQQFINSEHIEEIVFTSGTTASLNLVAQSLGSLLLSAGDVILLSPTEHHSNIVPWQLLADRLHARIEWFKLTEDGMLDENSLADSITDKVRIISLAQIANASGNINPIEKVIALAHLKDIPVVIDGAQSVPHRSVDVQNLDCDFLVFSSHKMCGPTGVGVLYGKRHWLEKMPPWQGGGDMIKAVQRNNSTWAELPHKFEAGTPNIAGVIGFAAAIEYLQSIGMDEVRRLTDDVYNYLLNKLESLDGVKIMGSIDRKYKSSIASFVMNNVHPHDIAQILDQSNVAVRAGHHCAQLLMEHWKVSATTRASVYFYNDKSDIDRLVLGLKKVYDKFK